MADSPELVNLTIDGVPVSVPKGTLLVEAAKTVKQEIPVYCYHTKLGPAGLCRICLVEIEGMPKLQIACNTPVAEGMAVHTQSEKAKTGRGMVLELFLVNHPLDCPICDKGGECDLQDYAMAYGRGSSDVADPKLSKPKGVDLGPTIVLDEERCVVCQRCVRFDDIIADERQLIVKDRGHNDIIATATGDPYRHHFTGNVTELCPVGALTSKTYRFKSRPWDLNRTQTTCTQCPVGCQQFSDVRYGEPLRTMSVEHDDAISDGWLCDRGRYNIGFYRSPERITQPLYLRDGTFVQIGWDDAFVLWARSIRDARGSNAGVGAIGGGRLLNEEAYLLQHVFRALGVRNLDWRAGRQQQASPGRRSGTYADLERADAIVIGGQTPAELAPVLWLRAIKAKRSGAQIHHVDAENAAQVIARIPAGARLAIVWDGVDLALGKTLAETSSGREAKTYIASEQGNARGAEAMGMLPIDGGMDGALMFDAARSGKLGALSLFGVNPLRNAADTDGVRAALNALPFVMVSELFMTETAQLADLVLPAKGAFEKTGTTVNLAGDLLPVNASLEAPAGPLSDLEMLIGLAQQFDLALPTIEELDAAVIARAASPFAGEFGDALYHSGALRQGDERARTPRTLWDGGGTAAHDDRVRAVTHA
ncbi:MAG TPA: molybdopterin-dependent oxidoreductase [Candidatus Baltobacteraceae bacterium]|nr:molybdopterin-dependent oxidoreductase [Candidatus Baltobacteraceae bacterium]